MASRYNIRKPLTGAYRVTDEFVKDIYRLFETTFQTQPKMTIKFKNRHQPVYDNISDFLSDSATRSEQIVSLSISSGWNRDFHAELDFSAGIVASVFFVVSGDRDRCILLEREVLNELKSIKSLHSFMHSGPAIEGLTVGIGGGAIASVLFAFLDRQPSFVEYVGGVAFAVICWSVIKSVLFPKFEFDLGKGRSAIVLRKNIIYFVFGMLIVGGIMAI